MIPILVYDTETSGLPDFRAPAEDPCQPHIVQLGAILYDANRRVVAELNVLIKPDGWIIPPETSAIHGITQEMAERHGLSLVKVMPFFMSLAERAELLVGHNVSFDEKMVRAQLHRLGESETAEWFRERPSYCTMTVATPIVNLPPTAKMIRAGFNKPKSANMQEAYSFFHNGKTFDSAHDAMADVRACAAVYFAMNPLPSVESFSTPTLDE